MGPLFLFYFANNVTKSFQTVTSKSFAPSNVRQVLNDFKSWTCTCIIWQHFGLRNALNYCQNIFVHAFVIGMRMGCANRSAYVPTTWAISLVLPPKNWQWFPSKHLCFVFSHISHGPWLFEWLQNQNEFCISLCEGDKVQNAQSISLSSLFYRLHYLQYLTTYSLSLWQHRMVSVRMNSSLLYKAAVIT